MAAGEAARAACFGHRGNARAASWCNPQRQTVPGHLPAPWEGQWSELLLGDTHNVPLLLWASSHSIPVPWDCAACLDCGGSHEG